MIWFIMGQFLLCTWANRVVWAKPNLKTTEQMGLVGKRYEKQIGLLNNGPA